MDAIFDMVEKVCKQPEDIEILFNDLEIPESHRDCIRDYLTKNYTISELGVKYYFGNRWRIQQIIAKFGRKLRQQYFQDQG